MRLFIALDLDAAIRERIASFMDGVRGFAPEARWMHPESMHVTLKFIGEQPESAVEPIKRELETIQAEAVQLQFRGYGFFPTAKSPRVFWIGVEVTPELTALAALVDAKVVSLGISKEDRTFSPHLTLARGRGASGSPRRRESDGPNPVFQRLQQKLSELAPPEFGTMTPREFFLYRSLLFPKGSKYTKLSAFALK